MKSLGRSCVKAGKLLVTKKIKNEGRVWEITESRNPKIVLSTLPEVITFYLTGKGLYLGIFV